MGAYDRLMQLDDAMPSFTAKARETISGGFVVCISGADDVVHGSGNTGGPTSIAFGDVLVSTIATSTDVRAAVGLATDTVTSGNEVGVLTDGIFILEAGSSGVTPGYPIYPLNYGNCFHDTPAISGTTVSYQSVGKALTGASAEQTFFVGKLRF